MNFSSCVAQVDIVAHNLRFNGENEELSLIQNKLLFLRYFSITGCVRKMTKHDTYLRYVCLFVCLSIRMSIHLNRAVEMKEFSLNLEIKTFSKISL